MKTPKKSKKTPKPPQGRPASTALISQPAVGDASSLYTLSSFSEQGNLFAYVSLAVDKHRLRVYNTTTGQAIADHTIDAARVLSMIWSTIDPGGSVPPAVNSDELQPNKKKKLQQDSALELGTKTKVTEVVILGLSDGTILCFSPLHGRILRTLSHASSTSPVSALAAEESEDQWLIWASGEDGTLHLWDAHKNGIMGTWKNDDRIPYSSLMIRPMCEGGRTDILAASHRIRLLSKPGGTQGILPKKLSQVAAFTGHASPIKSTKWEPSNSIPTRFISMAEADRFLYVWSVLDSPEVDSKAIASVKLDTDAKAFSLTSSADRSDCSILLTLSASGKVALYAVPHEISSLSSSSRSPAKLSTLTPCSNIVPSTKKSFIPAHIINASFVDGEQRNIRVARLVRNIQPVFTVVRYLDEAGQFIENLQLEDIPEITLEDTQPLISNRRYVESSIAVGSGVELGHGEDMDEVAGRGIDGDLQVDLAELSLGQRLTAVSDADARRTSDSEDEETLDPSRPKSSKKSKREFDIVPANSLTRTLIQALHSSDTKLVETCLAHSNPDLVRNTVKRLPPQLAIPLLNACVERLGRGARAANMKGGGAGASSQRGMTLITWIRTVLAVHTGHLMTVPDLIPRLSGLHTTLTARLALQESLLSLSGRLDMILSQIEMRSSLAPAPLKSKNSAASSITQEKVVKRYVEGESETSDDESEQMDVEVEIGDEEGSVEDIELGGDSEEVGSEEGGDEDEDSDEDEGGSVFNKFIDDEAEEYSEDEDEDESE